MEFLIKNEADVDRIADYGVTPLYLAAEVRCADTVTMLIDKGANVNARTERGETPLLAVVTIDRRFDVNEADVLKVVTLLVDKGADVFACNTRDEMLFLLLFEKILGLSANSFWIAV